MSSKFIHIVSCVRISFLLMANIPLYAIPIFCLFIHPSVDTCMTFTFWLLGVMVLWTLLLFSHSVVSDSAAPQTAACQAFLSFTIPGNILKLLYTELMIPSNHVILSGLLLLMLSIFPSIRVLSNESDLHIKCQSTGASASASVLPKNSQGWFLFGLTCLISLNSKGLSGVFSSPTVQKH